MCSEASRRDAFSYLMSTKIKTFALTFWELLALVWGNQHFRDFNLFDVDSKRRNCPLSRVTSAARAIARDRDKINGRYVWLRICYMWIFLLSKAKITSRFYPAVRSVTFHENCGLHWVTLFANSLIIFCIVVATAYVTKYLSKCCLNI